MSFQQTNKPFGYSSPRTPVAMGYYGDNFDHVSRPRAPVIETKYVLKKNGPMGTTSQASAAASFFAKAHQRLQMNITNEAGGHGAFGNNNGDEEEDERQSFPTNFRAIVHRSPPQVPSSLLKKLELSPSAADQVGKIRVLLRVAKSSSLLSSPDGDVLGNQIFQMDRRRRQLTIYDPTMSRVSSIDLEERKVGVAAPKMFAFDNVFTDQDPQEDIANSALTDVIASVVNGNDGCLFCFGHANLGKSRSMLGSDESSKSMGIIPIAIAWLYRAIKERKTRSGARFSVRVSALEVTSQRENLRDLLEPYNSDNDQSPGMYLRNLPVNRPASATGQPSAADYLANQSELRASSADKAAFYLDAALAARSADTRGRESHLLFTLHVYQYTGVSGGRSRLHLLDFGGCERSKTPGGGITLSGLGNVILGIFNGQKHLPHRDSKVTQLLRECLGSLTCQATMLAHVSPEPSRYSETLHTVQLASRLHRLRRKRLKSSSSRIKSSSGSRSGSGSSSGLTTSTNASSSEFSCDTVVYRGHSDGSGTDSEHPPGLMLLRTSRNGSLDEIPRPASGNGHRRKKILTNGAISPRQCLSPLPYISRTAHHGLASPMPGSSLSGSCLPAIPEVVHSSKMPLSGLVPAQSSHRLRMQQQQFCNQESPRRPLLHYQAPAPSSEMWLDQQQPNCVPQQQQQQQMIQQRKVNYGYMDMHKASMINNWVETQSVSGESVFLTQFKQVESDENVNSVEQQHKVIVHHEEQPQIAKAAKPKPPPPPPRRTPPRETSLVFNIPETIPMIDEIIEVKEEMTNAVPTSAEMSCQVDEQDLRDEDDEEECCNVPAPHPLRILSEENLTIVSSFAGSLNELPNDEDELRDDIVDPSKLSFFKVPDLSHIGDQTDRIMQTFRELEEMHNCKNNNETSREFKQAEEEGNNDVLDTKPKMTELITPQKQFLLLSQSLRHPDGSSNPELNFMMTEKIPQRSPGNGRSSSDLEDDAAIKKVDNAAAVTSPSGNNNSIQMINEQQQPSKIIVEQHQEKAKASSKFGFKFFKLFGSSRLKKGSSNIETTGEPSTRRAKSCDRKLDVYRPQLSNVRSVSSSPLTKKNELISSNNELAIEDPSMLSISTEWEFEPQEDEDNGNCDLPPSVFNHLLVHSKLNNKDRKSSGYDSLGGDESSSLDSNESKPHLNIKLSREMNNSLAKSFFAKRPAIIHPEIQPQYSMPNDFYGHVNIMQYDEVDILRMEQRRNSIKK